MEVLMWMMYGGGALRSGMDVAAALVFVAFAVIYLLVPRLGYSTERRTGMVAALYILIGYRESR